MYYLKVVEPIRHALRRALHAACMPVLLYMYPRCMYNVHVYRSPVMQQSRYYGTPVRERGSVGRVQWCSEMVMTPVFFQSVANETCAIQSIQE